MHAKGTKQVRESAAVSDCTEISCVRKVGEPRIRKLSAYEIFWIYSTLPGYPTLVGQVHRYTSQHNGRCNFVATLCFTAQWLIVSCLSDQKTLNGHLTKKAKIAGKNRCKVHNRLAQGGGGGGGGERKARRLHTQTKYFPFHKQNIFLFLLI